MARKIRTVLILTLGLMSFPAITAAQSGTLFVEGDNVGIGTATPESRLHLLSGVITVGGHTTGERPVATQDFLISGLRNVIYNIDSDNDSTNGSFSVSRDGDPNAVLFVTREDERTGFNIQFPNHPLHVGTNSSNGNGAHLTAGGVWTNGSSRASKQNILALDPADAQAALAGLEPVRFEYQGEPGEQYVGFIAEDVPELVAQSDRKTLSSMDIVAVLTKIVQEQQAVLAEQDQAIVELRKQVEELRSER